MTRPLIITDCDEVLLHMVRHFRSWLDKVHDVEFKLDGHSFIESMRRRGATSSISEEEMWSFLGGFFDSEMDSQTPIEGAINAVLELQKVADLVVLTNLVDARNTARKEQLLGLGVDVPIYTNQGPKGPAIKAIVEEYGAKTAVFIDDIGEHHHSASCEVPHIRRLHFCGEPAIAPHISCAHKAGAAHARIDSWDKALPWVLSQID